MSATRPPAGREADQEERGGAGADLAVVLLWYVVLGVVAGLAWWQLAPELTATRAEDGVVLQADQLRRQVGVDGWFVSLALGGGLLSGAVLLWRRPARPTLMVVLVALGGVAAGAVCFAVGVWLGPPDPQTVLAAQEVGSQAPLDLRLQSDGLVWAWSMASVLGALAYLVVRGPDPADDRRPQGRQTTSPTP